MMTNLLSELNETLFDEYMTCSMEEVDMLRIQKQKEPIDAIIELIGDYNTLKILLNKEELKLELLKLEYEQIIYVKQQEYMQKGLKSTEAKTKSRIDYKKENQEILQKEMDIQILKANIHSTEYQLRLQFKRYDEKNHIIRSIKDGTN